MMKFLLVAFFAFIFVFIFLGAILKTIIRYFLPKAQGQGRNSNQRQSTNNSNSTTAEIQKQFSDDVGEYVSYEEIKED